MLTMLGENVVGDLIKVKNVKSGIAVLIIDAISVALGIIVRQTATRREVYRAVKGRMPIEALLLTITTNVEILDQVQTTRVFKIRSLQS